MRSNKSYVKETLAFVNKHLKKAGAAPLDDLLPGKMCGAECPVTNSLGTGYENVYTNSMGLIGLGPFGYDEVNKESTRIIVRAPRAVRRFVRAFDTGRLPEYHI